MRRHRADNKTAAATSGAVLKERYRADTKIVSSYIDRNIAVQRKVSRIGDDVSGRDWDRTRRMGVNSLAFRAPQHGTFFAADADCVGLISAEEIPWKYNGQWLDLLARSGTPLFISFKEGSLTAEQETEVADALACDAQPQPTAEPQDWMETRLPRTWKFHDTTKVYDWGSEPPAM